MENRQKEEDPIDSVDKLLQRSSFSPMNVCFGFPAPDAEAKSGQKSTSVCSSLDKTRRGRSNSDFCGVNGRKRWNVKRVSLALCTSFCSVAYIHLR